MESKLNNTIQLLNPGESFIGKNEIVNGYLNIVCNLKATKDCVITVEQSTNGTDYQFSDQFSHVVSVFGTQTRTEFFVKAYYVRISVFNATVDEIPKLVLTTLFSNANQDSSDEQPSTIVGSVSVLNSIKATYNDGVEDILKNVACDVNGVLKSNLVIEGITLTPSTDGVGSFGSSDGVDRVIIKTDATGILETNDTAGNLLLTTIGESIDALDCIGAAPQYVVYATPDNYSAAIAADGDPAVIVEGGWLYKNGGGSSKINWYVYANLENQAPTAKKVSDIKNIYMVINQQTPLTAVSRNPFIAFYTLRDAGTNTSWYKNRYVFVNDRESAEVVGPKLLYTGVDNPLIHPEITTRVQLLFNAETSTATLEEGANELVWLSSIQTSSGTLANEYNFVLSEYGNYYTIDGLKRVPLPIINNKVQCELLTLPAITGSVSVSNFPAVQNTIVDSGSLAVNNLGDIETKLTEISTQTLAISNVAKYPSFTSAFSTTPEEISTGSSVDNSEFSMTNILDNVVYKNVMYMGYVDVSVNTDPQLVLQYSDDQAFWFSDGVGASFYKATATTWHFAFQRSLLGAKYVRLAVKNTTTLNRCSVNLSV